MRGPRLVVTLNGTKTVDVEDKKFTSGPIALQYMVCDKTGVCRRVTFTASIELRLFSLHPPFEVG